MKAQNLLATIGNFCRSNSVRTARRAALCTVLFAMAPLACAQVYKCTDSQGKTTYADAPCSAAAKPLRLQDDTKAGATDPNVCVALRDETHRLAAEVQRNAERGRKETNSAAAQRHALDQKYAARCMGIARSAPKPG
jgi:hypothetical protein